MMDRDTIDARHDPDTRSEPATRAAGLAGLAGETLFHAIFDNSFQFMGVLSPDGTLLEANQAALRFAGLTRADVVGRPFWETPWWADSEEKRQRLRGAIAQAARGGFVRYEVEVFGRDGRHAIIDFSLSPVFDATGGVVLIIPEGRDVTGMRLAERERRITEEKFKAIVAISSDAIISIDDRQRIVHFNQGAEQIFGWVAQDVLGQPLDVLLPERFRAMHGDHVRRFAASPIASRRMGERQEISGLRRNGEEFPADASISKLEVDGSRLFTVVLRDVSERKRSERTQRFLAEAGSLLAASLDVDTTLRSITRLAVSFFADYCVLYEKTAEGEIRRLGAAHADPGKAAQLARIRGQLLHADASHPALVAIETGETVLVPEMSRSFLRAQAVDDRHFALLRELEGNAAIVAPLVARGITLGAIGFFSANRARRYGPEDIALANELALRAAVAMDNALLYQEARDAVRARDDILAVVSHDLGNPLSAIRIGASLLLRTVPEEQRTGVWRHIEGIRHSVEQMERLINDLLEVKRIEAGHLSLNRRRQSPAALANEVVDLMQPLAAERAQTLELDVPATLPEVTADRERILQVFSNLVGNALKFTPEGGRIRIAAYAPEGSGDVVFAVSDTGRGIEPEHIEHVFDRFWQAHRHRREGIGLGLAIVKGIVQAHGGRVWVESAPGTGSTFSFTLPVAAPGRVVAT